jgi:hypothetical protein
MLTNLSPNAKLIIVGWPARAIQSAAWSIRLKPCATKGLSGAIGTANPEGGPMGPAKPGARTCPTGARISLALESFLPGGRPLVGTV